MSVGNAFIICALLAGLSGGSAVAAESALGGGGNSHQLRASDLLGMDVINPAGDSLGEIDDLSLSPDGSIQAVLALGGFFGLGEKMVILGFDAMQFDDEREHLIVNMTREQLKGMGDFNYMEGETKGVIQRQASTEVKEKDYLQLFGGWR